MFGPGLGRALAVVRASAVALMFYVAVILSGAQPASAMDCEDDLRSCHDNADDCLDETGWPGPPAECYAFEQEECPGELICTAGQGLGCLPSNNFAVVCRVL